MGTWRKNLCLNVSVHAHIMSNVSFPGLLLRNFFSSERCRVYTPIWWDWTLEMHSSNQSSLIWWRWIDFFNFFSSNSRCRWSSNRFCWVLHLSHHLIVHFTSFWTFHLKPQWVMLASSWVWRALESAYDWISYHQMPRSELQLKSPHYSTFDSKSSSGIIKITL